MMQRSGLYSNIHVNIAVALALTFFSPRDDILSWFRDVLMILRRCNDRTLTLSRHTMDLQKGCSDHVEVMSGRWNSWELLFLLLARFMTCPLTLSCHAITPKPHNFFRPLIFPPLVPKVAQTEQTTKKKWKKRIWHLHTVKSTLCIPAADFLCVLSCLCPLSLQNDPRH